MQTFRRALGSVKSVVLLALVVVPVTAATAVGTADHDTPRGSLTAALARDLVVPVAHAPSLCHDGGAIIRTPSGHLRAVSLARGLMTYEHRAPGDFLQLCTSPGD